MCSWYLEPECSRIVHLSGGGGLGWRRVHWGWWVQNKVPVQAGGGVEIEGRDEGGRVVGQAAVLDNAVAEEGAGSEVHGKVDVEAEHVEDETDKVEGVKASEKEGVSEAVMETKFPPKWLVEGMSGEDTWPSGQVLVRAGLVLVDTLILDITGVFVDTSKLEVEKVLVDLVLILALFLFCRSLISFTALFFSSRKIEFSFLALATFSLKFSFLVFKLFISLSLVFTTFRKESSSFLIFSDSTFKLLENAFKSVTSSFLILLASFNWFFSSMMSSISTLAFSSFKLRL